MLLNLLPTDFEGADYSAREALKMDGWKLYGEGRSVEEKAASALKAIYAHFERSRESAAVQRRKHPVFAEYAGHWLWSEDRLPSTEVKKYLVEMLPLPDKPRIEKGKSYWR